MAEHTRTLGRNWLHGLGDYYESEFVSITLPYVMQWTLVTYAWKVLLIQFSFFVFIVYIGPAVMKKRKPFDLRWFMIPYNAFLVVTNFYLFFQYFKMRRLGGTEVECDNMEATINNPNIYRFAEITWYFYMTKYIELIDTIIFVLRKKDRQLSFLHIVHHTFVPIVVFFLLRSEPGGYNTFFPIANSFVHCVMYTYYGISALGEDVTIHLKFKKYVTMVQMIQFILVLSFYITRPFYGCYRSPTLVYGNLLLAGFFFILFCNFYWNEYNKRPAALVQNGTKNPKKVR